MSHDWDFDVVIWSISIPVYKMNLRGRIHAGSVRNRHLSESFNVGSLTNRRGKLF